jgi:hypothetical protein
MFDKILEYQKIEGSIIKLESELSKSGDREKAAAIQQELKSGVLKQLNITLNLPQREIGLALFKNRKVSFACQKLIDIVLKK